MIFLIAPSPYKSDAMGVAKKVVSILRALRGLFVLEKKG